MRMPSRVRANRAVRIACAAIIVAILHAARAASFDYADASADRLPFDPGHFVFDGSGAWAVGNATARFRSDGSPAFVVPVQPFGGDALLAATADGGVAEAGVGLPATPYALPCLVQKLDANGARQWQRAADSVPCVALASDGDATLWIATEAPSAPNPVFVYRVGIDGSGFAQIAFPSDFVPLAVSAAPGAGAYVAGYAASSASASIVALDGSGATTWRWTDTSAGATLTHVAVDTSGNVVASGYDTGHALVAVSLTGAGAMRWNARLSAPGVDRQSGFELAADGSAFALVPAQDQSHRVLEKIGADGTLAWQSDVPVAALGSVPSWLDGQMGLRLAPNGDILVLADMASTDAPTTRLIRFDANGTAGPTTMLPGSADATRVDASAMAALPDSSALVTTRSDFESGGLATLGAAASDGLFVHVDLSGAVVSGPFAAAQVPAADVLADALVADDGTTYLLANNLLGEVADRSIGGLDARYALSAISASGALLWKVEANGYVQSVRLVAGDGRVCIVGDIAQYFLLTWVTPAPPAGGEGDLVVECHDAASGAARGSADVHAAASTPATLAGTAMAADGSVTVGYLPPFDGVTPTEFDLATVDAGGAIAATHSVPGSMVPYAMGADGSTLLAIAPQDADASAMLVRADGSTAYRVTLPQTRGLQIADVLSDDSAEIVALDASGNLIAATIAPSGSVSSPARLASGVGVSQIAGIALSDDASNAYVTLVLGAEQSGTQGAKMFAIDRAGGAFKWTTSLAEPMLQGGFAIPAASGAPIFYSISDYRVGTRSVDADTGVIGSTTYRGCGNVACTAMRIRGARVTADGALRYAIDNGMTALYDPGAPHAVGIDAMESSPPDVPVAQPGIAGAWYATYASGQGFTIDYLAASGTLFVPWFTFTADGGHEPSSRAWYTLQGNASSDGDRADLTIYSSAGGAFASGTTTPQAVGSATLAFSDCSHGTLAYQFDASHGASGTITITRLTPATADCVKADGSTQPAGSFAPFNGFDASDSGSWYDPATSGQGIELTVVPPSSTSAGMLFGAWFTYAPAGDASDGATKQQWFTLQGDLAGADGGAVTVPIFATLGGSFDGAPADTTLAVGSATLTFADCALTVDYRFDDSSLAHAYRALGGTLHLVKLGGCP